MRQVLNFELQINVDLRVKKALTFQDVGHLLLEIVKLKGREKAQGAKVKRHHRRY